MAVQDLERIEQRLDRTVAGALEVSDNLGGVLFKDMAQVMEFAKLLSLAGAAVPKHLRGNPGACLAITIQALEWRMSPIAVSNQSYEVGDKIAYMSQLIHAVVETRAPLKNRLRRRYEGEGGKRKCIVIGHFRGEVDPVEYESPEFDKIQPKNSPLWKTDPDQQQWFYSTRAFARAFCPDVLLGIYSEDELEGAGSQRATDITPVSGLKDRLTGKAIGPGFSAEHVAAQIDHSVGVTLDVGQPTKDQVPVATEPDGATKTRKHKTVASDVPKLSNAASANEVKIMAGGHDVTERMPLTKAELEKQRAEKEAANQDRGEASDFQEPQDVHEQRQEPEPEHIEPEPEEVNEAPTAAFITAMEALDNVEKTIIDIKDLEALKKEGRSNIDKEPGLTDDERDELRARFTTILLTEQRRRAQKGRR